MTLNNNINRNSARSTALLEQSAADNETNTGSLENIQTVSATSTTIATNAASSDAQPASVVSSKIILDICRCNCNFLNTRIKKLTTKLNDALADQSDPVDQSVVTEDRQTALQEIEKEIMEANKAISESVSEFEPQLAQLETSQDKVTGADYISRIKALGEKAQALVAKCQAANASSQEDEFAELCHCTHAFFKSSIKDLTVKLNEIQANQYIGVDERRTSLQALEQELAGLIDDIDSAVADLAPQLAELEDSLGKAKAANLIEQMQALSEKAYTSLLDCKEAIIDTTVLPTENGLAIARTFAEVVDNLDMYELMAEGFASTEHYIYTQFISLLEKAELSIKEQAKWKELAMEAVHLRGKMKTQAKILSKYTDMADEEIDLDLNNANLRAVRSQLIKIYNSIVASLKQAEQNIFPALSPTEYAADMERRFQKFINEYDNLKQRAVNLQNDLEHLAKNVTISETERQEQLSVLFGERKLISREALSVRKRLRVLVTKVETQRQRDRLNDLRVSLRVLGTQVRDILPSIEFAPTERLRFEGLNLPEFMTSTAIPSGRSTSSEHKKGVRFNPNVAVTEVAKYIGKEEEIEVEVEEEVVIRPRLSREDLAQALDDMLLPPDVRRTNSSSAQASTSNDISRSVTGIPYGDVVANRDSRMSGVSLDADIANLDDFADED